MSLKEELSALQASEKRKKEQEEAMDRLPFKIVCSQYPLSETDKALLKEAVELIDPNKWRTAKLLFEKKDLEKRDTEVYTEVYYERAFCCNYYPNTVPYKRTDLIKVSYNGQIKLAKMKPVFFELKKKDAGFFYKRKCKLLKDKALNKINDNALEAKQYLFGEQQFVLWKCGYEDNDYMVVFRDGTIFTMTGRIERPFFHYGSSFEDGSHYFKGWVLKNLKDYSH